MISLFLQLTYSFSEAISNIIILVYKGLGCHLNSSHDLFHYEFWVGKRFESPLHDLLQSSLFYKYYTFMCYSQIFEEYQIVNVSLKADAWRTEVN